MAGQQVRPALRQLPPMADRQESVPLVRIFSLEQKDTHLHVRFRESDGAATVRRHQVARDEPIVSPRRDHVGQVPEQSRR